jgi:hypothetical protein
MQSPAAFESVKGQSFLLFLKFSTHPHPSQMVIASEEVAAQAGAVATATKEMAATSGNMAKNHNQAADGSHHTNGVAT